MVRRPCFLSLYSASTSSTHSGTSVLAGHLRGETYYRCLVGDVFAADDCD